jgi:hypothetical protein
VSGSDEEESLYSDEYGLSSAFFPDTPFTKAACFDMQTEEERKNVLIIT